MGKGLAISVQRSLAFATFGVVYFFLAAYAANLPHEPRLPLLVWPAHGLLLGVLLIRPLNRWPAYLFLVLAASLIVAFELGAPWQRVLAMLTINLGLPVVVAAGVIRLSRPAIDIDTVRGLSGLLVGMAPLTAAVAVLEGIYSQMRYEAPLREQWAVTFASDMVGMLLLAPLILAWRREEWREGVEEVRTRLPEIVVLYGGLILTTNYVFGTGPEAAGYIAPLAYLCAPFLIWAALRFGLRAATLGLAIFGLLTYWHTAHGLGPFAMTSANDIVALLHLQGYLATVVITTLFAGALLAERHAAEAETEAWRRRHEAVIRASGNLLYEFEPQGDRILWDGDTQAVLGVPREKIATLRQWMARVHPDDRIRLKGLRELFARGEIYHVTLEYRFLRDDGEYTTIGVNGYLIEDVGKGRRLIGFVKDVSEKLHAEEERIRLASQLKQAEKMEAVGHLAGGIAHDFNNILGAILGYGELAQKRAGEGDLRRYIDTIMNAGNRAKALVTQILSYSRAEGSQKSPVIVSTIAREARDLVAGSTPSSIVVDFSAEDEEAAVMGDPTRLHQLFMNLLTNAVHAMGEGGRLEIRLDIEKTAESRKVRTGIIVPGEYVRITVLDTGHGIAPEVIDRIFEPFFTTKPAGRGTGLGLALVHSVVKEHHGYIDVQSELGRGTTFTIWLPRTTAGAPAVEAEKPQAVGRGQVVLAVDDEPEVLAALEEMLASLGYEPAGFASSREALEAVQRDPRRFELVVSDEVMPELTGTQLATELRKVNPTLPIVIASGYGGSGFETRALSAGVNRVLRKPYRMKELGETLAGLLPHEDEVALGKKTA